MAGTPAHPDGLAPGVWRLASGTWHLPPDTDWMPVWLRPGGSGSEPVRADAGMAGADDVEDRARLAVDDLERAGGFTRDHLLVATTTASGCLDVGTLESFANLTRGDAAIVST